MIKFALKCGQGHGFDGWFRDGATYDEQAAGGHIECPQCGDRGIRKAPMAPRIARGGTRDQDMQRRDPDPGTGNDSYRAPDPGEGRRGDAMQSGEGDAVEGGAGEGGAGGPMPRHDMVVPVAVADRMRELLQTVKRHVEKNCEYVGDRFAEEARRIHHGESDERGIYGEASEEEERELQEEGIDVARNPWPRRTDS